MKIFVILLVFMTSQFMTTESMAQNSFREQFLALLKADINLYHSSGAASDAEVKKFTDLVMSADSGREFAVRVAKMVQLKPTVSLPGYEDSGFYSKVYPRLNALSEQFELSDDDRAMIDNAFKAAARADSQFKRDCKRYSALFWGKSALDGPIHEFFGSLPNFYKPGDVDTQRLVSLLSTAKNGTDFARAVAKILGMNVDRTFSGYGESYFYGAFEAVNAASEKYRMTQSDRDVISRAFAAVALTNSTKSDLILSCNNLFWGS